MSKINFILRTFMLVYVVGFLLTCALVCRAATPDAEALLKHSDVYRNGWPSYVLRVKITNYESGKSDEESLFEVSQKGTEKSYIEFLSPREKGQHLLMLGDDMWIYLPDTSRPIRITPLERLTGNASNGDVARTNYVVDYAPVYLRTEKVGVDNCYVLDLTAKRKGATYQRITYWLRVDDARPVRLGSCMAKPRGVNRLQPSSAQNTPLSAASLSLASSLLRPTSRIIGTELSHPWPDASTMRSCALVSRDCVSCPVGSDGIWQQQLSQI